ncbi:MAG: molybdenum cofactor synthesis protein [Ignavibacteria bacterium]|nr:MAG: molybdenum cofactor synthesis protein [Ignavibacteria bacterium]KAF0160683.1 MAG: molybdenum cofactor synthesis protein [Ignavibacteria bacterium]
MNRYIVSLNISEEKGTIKTPREQVEVNKQGIVGDAHSGNWHRQVSMLAQEDIDNFSLLDADNRKFLPGEFAENITTLGIDFKKVSLLDKFKIGEVELEVTQIGKKCHGDGCAIFVEVGKCVMPKSGIFTRVVTNGTLRTNAAIEYFPRPLKIKIITLSDRAFSGEYKDLSGPAIKKNLEEHFANKRWRCNYFYSLIPDDGAKLLSELQKSVDEKIDVVFTTGGTGIGPRDITPEIVEKFADKLIPGIMEQIRLKYSEAIPSSVLSRSVAAVKNETLIFSLPGSVKAVEDYMEEILKVLEHAVLMIHGLGH